MKSYLPGHILGVEVAPDRIRHLILKFAKIAALRCDPTLTGGRIPGCDQDTGFLRGLYLKHDFFHVSILQLKRLR